jgi:hypothetical protein
VSQSLNFSINDLVDVSLHDGVCYIDVGAPSEEDYQLLGIRIVKEGKYSHHDRRHFEVTLNTFLRINDSINSMIPPRIITLKVPDVDLMGSDHDVIIYMIDKETICLFSHSYRPHAIDPIVLTMEEWKAIMKCYEENKGQFPSKKSKKGKKS